MPVRLSGATYIMEKPPCIYSFASVGGKDEGEGPLGNNFDKINDDPYMTSKTYEQGESQLQKQSVRIALEKAHLKPENIDFMFGGDLLNQCIGTTFGIKDYEIPFLGIYGACSTMAEGLLLSGLLCDSGVGKKIVAVTSSHFCSAERQYRFPLEYGGQRTPTAQHTATASGAVVVSSEGTAPFIRAVTIGRIVDMGITDANNMGAAMAPAAFDVITRFLKDTQKAPSFFDYIVTGDLGKVGSELLCSLMEKEKISIGSVQKDCGIMLYDIEKQDMHAGGSGCGCSGGVLCGYFLPKLKSGEIKNILFVATGALMSPTINQQGETIPSIAHAVWISAE